MRFQGQGYRDHVLTNNEKENLKHLLSYMVAMNIKEIY